MEQLQIIGGYEITRSYNAIALRRGDEIIHEVDAWDIGEVLFEDVSNDEEFEESERFLQKEIVGDLREKGVPANVASAFAEEILWLSGGLRNKTW